MVFIVFIHVLQFVGIKCGDYLVSVEDRDVRWDKHEQVITLINMVVDMVRLKIVTPVEKNNIKARYTVL